MQIMNLLETLATQTRFECHNILENELNETKEIFASNDTSALKSMFPKVDITADRTTIFTL